MYSLADVKYEVIIEKVTFKEMCETKEYYSASSDS